MNGIKIEAAGKAYTLIYTVGSLCALEEKLGTGVTDIVGALADRGAFRLTTARVLFWGALLEHHPETTIADAGKIMDAIGIGKASALISAAVLQAFPPNEGEGGGAPRPLETAQLPDGTGARSLRNGRKPGSGPAISGS
jgi:hypothetical protein